MVETTGAEYLKSLATAEVIDLNNPNCSSCNECCSIGTMLLPDEYLKLKKYLTKDKQGKIAYKEALTRFRNVNKGRTISLMCPFSNSSRRCSIYSIRPSVCREFHCSKELSKDFDKSKYESVDHYTIMDFFKNKK